MELALTADETRVLGVLVEKERSTPEYYPMTLNALRAGCNQKTNREPVVSFSQAHVQRVLDQLHKKRLVGLSTGQSGRVARYRHTLAAALGLDERQLSVLCLLMLRGPQTPGELRARSSRLFSFADIEELVEVLDQLRRKQDPPLIRELPRRPGQKEERYVHDIGDEEYIEESSVLDSDDPVSALQTALEDLADRLAELERSFEAFRRQFE